MKPRRICRCGGRYLSYGVNYTKEGIKRSRLKCQQCKGTKTIYTAQDGSVVRIVEHELVLPMPLNLEPPCRWFSTLPVPGCVSLRA